MWIGQSKEIRTLRLQIHIINPVDETKLIRRKWSRLPPIIEITGGPTLKSNTNIGFQFQSWK